MTLGAWPEWLRSLGVTYSPSVLVRPGSEKTDPEDDTTHLGFVVILIYLAMG